MDILLCVTSEKKVSHVLSSTHFPSKKRYPKTVYLFSTLPVFAICNTPKKGSVGTTANFLFGVIGNRHFFLGFGVYLLWRADHKPPFIHDCLKLVFSPDSHFTLYGARNFQERRRESAP